MHVHFGPDALAYVTTFDVIHDLARPRDALRGIARSLRPGGTYLMVDIAASSNLHENMDHAGHRPLRRLAHSLHDRLPVPGRRGPWQIWGEQKARELLAEAGFERVSVEQIEGDIVNNYYVATKG